MKNLIKKPFIIIIAVVLSLAGGILIGHFIPALSFLLDNDPHHHSAFQEENEKQLWTCSMHPQVIQDHPGDCPICHMKLTPLKQKKNIEQSMPTDKKKDLWTCSMHPQVIQDKPGNCPICGMALVKKEVKNDDGNTAEIPENAVIIDPVVVQNMGIRVKEATKGSFSYNIRTNATLLHDESALVYVTTRFNGYIETLNADTTGQFVKKGQVLFSYYSPEITQAQQEYALALRRLRDHQEDQLLQSKEPSGSSNPLIIGRQSDTQETFRRIEDNLVDLTQAAEAKLRLLDISEDQINSLRSYRDIQRNFTLTSPINGVVLDKMVIKGQAFRAGQELFKLVNLSNIWVHAQLYENDLPYVRVGQTATITLPYDQNERYVGKVTFINHHVDLTSRTIYARIEVSNNGHKLKPGMFANVEINAGTAGEQLFVPEEAVLDTGTRKVLFVKVKEGVYQPKLVKTGKSNLSNEIAILEGLNEGDLVVTSGQFMLDSESKLQEALAKMSSQGLDQKMIPHQH